MGQVLTSRAGHHQREAFFSHVAVHDKPRNVVLFGETGVGKSSIINMLTAATGSDTKVPHISNRAVGGTFKSSSYPVSIANVQYVLWDTAGLNEGENGSVPADVALAHLFGLVRELSTGLSLLVYCISGSRYRDILKVNYEVFVRLICQDEIPVVLIITGLENETARMSDWWSRNKKEFSGRGMSFAGCACVTTIKGRGNVFLDRYRESRGAIQALIAEHCHGIAWTVASDRWWKRVITEIQEYYSANGYLLPAHRVTSGLAPSSSRSSKVIPGPASVGSSADTTSRSPRADGKLPTTSSLPETSSRVPNTPNPLYENPYSSISPHDKH